MIKASLIDQGTDKQLHSAEGYGEGSTLVTGTQGALFGFFKSIRKTASGTSVVVTPTGSGAIVLTDLIVTTEKSALGIVTVRFSDGTYTEEILESHVNEGPLNLAIPFTGRWLGWESAWIEINTSTTMKASLCCGYFKVGKDKALSYNQWNALR